MTSAVGLRQQHEVETRLVAMMNGSFDAQAELRGLDHDLDAFAKLASGPVATSVTALRAKVSGLASGHGESSDQPSPEIALPHVAEELGQIYSQVGSADATPTASQTAALTAVEKDYAHVVARWKAIKSTDLPALNHQLSGAGLAVIQLKADPEPASESENEE
jgi:hypothetical protein